MMEDSMVAATTHGAPEYATARELGLMVGSPPPPESRVNRGNWLFPPYNRWAFSHMTELMPCAEVSRGAAAVRPLPEQLLDASALEAVAVTDHTGTPRPLAEMLRRTYSDALLVLHHGHLVYERYDNDLAPDQRHLLASVTKSFTGLLTLMAIDDGLVDPDRPPTDYVPALAGSGFADTTVQQVLDMVVEMEWDELEWLGDDPDPAQEEAQFLKFLRATGSWVDRAHDPGWGVWDFARTLEQRGTPGRRFQYLTPATDVLGWILTAVHGQSYVQTLSERIWSRIGAERSAMILLDPTGTPVTSGGLNVTARDLARFGQLLLDGGRFGEDQVVPTRVVDELRAGGDVAAFARAPEVAHMTGWSYRAQWWIVPGGRPSAWGVCGQILWIDHERDLVIVRLASAPDAVDATRDVDESAICDAVTDFIDTL
jgi:CubicO group peptidase (beta-lactamase class C family)